MFCKNCGKEMADGVAFCPSCGQGVKAEVKPSNNGTVKLIIHRKSSFFGCAVSTKIHIDGQLVASIKSNGIAEFDMVPGTHELVLDMWSATERTNIEIPADCKTVRAEIGLKMGFWTNKIKVLSITNER